MDKKNKIILLLSAFCILFTSWHLHGMSKLKDGIIKLADTKKEIRGGNSAYFRFYPTTKIFRIRTKSQFDQTSRNCYEVRVEPSLDQGPDGPCGYYALWNLYSLKRKGGNPLNRKSLEQHVYGWKNLINEQKLPELEGEKTTINNWLKKAKNDRKNTLEKELEKKEKEVESRTREELSAFDRLTHDDILYLLEKSGIKALKEQKNILLFDPHNSVKNFSVKGYGSIGNKFGYGELDNNHIRYRFRKYGDPLYIVASSGYFNKINAELGLQFKWDSNWDNRFISSHDGHWFAIKFEWLGDPGKGAIKLTVMDSWAQKDDRYAKLVHYYYWWLVHSPIN